MRFIVKDQPDWIGQWVADQVGFEYIPGRMTAIGLVDENERVLGGVLFYDYSGTNIWLHVAATPGCHGAVDFVKAVFDYVFVQCGCVRCSGWVPASNKAALVLDRKLGFRPEYEMADAGPDGTSVLLGMYREDCKWIKG